ncbi:tautomerase family protein [Bacillus sp. EAC]|uniref:tautomerase family protein n=1 Tax=Bacillus sp. EAC TaxID=1978338 RepID=UPI000B43EEBB|nr:tautomerase family protein [Bacillus sp. EAC]
MPIIQIQMLEGRSTELKKELMKEINEVVCRTLEVLPVQVKVLINEYPKGNWSTGGVTKAEESY